LVKVPKILSCVLLVCPPVKEALLIVGSDQLYVVPTGTIPLVILVGVTLNSNPLQTVALIGLITAVGLTVTSTVKVAPIQFPSVAVGVIV
jgi:hypothetical protein